MNEYVTVFSTTGILGLICLLVPFFYGCIGLIHSIRTSTVKSTQRNLLCLFIAMVSSMIAGCNGSLNLIYGIWILLAMVYIAITNDKENENEKHL